jgi:hypothetical protein
MKKLRLTIYLFTVCALLAACSGDDGDPGPQGQSGAQGAKGEKGDRGAKGDNGDQGEDGTDTTGEYFKQGSFEGTITGTRRDGTVINETFNYEYRLGDLESFTNTLYLERYSSAAGARYIGLQLKKSGDVLTPEGFWLNYQNELNATTLLSLDISAEFLDRSGLVNW